MKTCFGPGDLFPSPPLSKQTQGRIFYRLGQRAEDKIAADYLSHAGRHEWYPAPLTAVDFRDGNQGTKSKTIYRNYLIDRNPSVDKDKLDRHMNGRQISGEDGQILYIPDFVGSAAPVNNRFYEVKPGRWDEDNHAGEMKIAAVQALMDDMGLPYKAGQQWRPIGKKFLFLFNVPLFGPIPVPIRITFEYCRHDRIDGLVVYHFCAESKLLDYFLAHVLAALVAYVVVAIWFPDILKDIPVPKIPNLPPIEPTPRLPAPVPIPYPVPRVPWPIPQPAPAPPPSPAPKKPVPVPEPAWNDFYRKMLQYVGETRSLSSRSVASPIQHAVGVGGRNVRRDVATVQVLINACHLLTRQPSIIADGLCGPITCGAIKNLQQLFNLPAKDGRIDPGGPTLSLLSALMPIAASQIVSSGSGVRVFGGASDATGGGVVDPMDLLMAHLAHPISRFR